METEIKKYLFDIHESIDSIENYLGSKRDFNINRLAPTGSWRFETLNCL